MSVVKALNIRRLQAGSIIEFTENFCLHQFIQMPTREKKCIFDQYFTKCQEPVQEYEGNPWKASEHRLITVKISLMKNQGDKSPPDGRGTGFHMLNLLIPLTNWTAIKIELSQLVWHSFEDVHQVDEHSYSVYD